MNNSMQEWHKLQVLTYIYLWRIWSQKLFWQFGIASSALFGVYFKLERVLLCLHL